MRGAVSGFVTGLCLLAVFAVGATLVTQLPERLQPAVPLADPPLTIADRGPEPEVPAQPVVQRSTPDTPVVAQSVPNAPQTTPPVAEPEIAPPPSLARLPVPEVTTQVDRPIVGAEDADQPTAPQADQPVTANRVVAGVAAPQTETAPGAPEGPAAAPAAPVIQADDTPIASPVAPDVGAEEIPLPEVLAEAPDVQTDRPSLTRPDAPRAALPEIGPPPTEQDVAPGVAVSDPPETTKAVPSEGAAIARVPDDTPPSPAQTQVTEAPQAATPPEQSEIAQQQPPTAQPEVAAPTRPVIRRPDLTREEATPRIGTRVSNLIERREAVPVRRIGVEEAALSEETRVSDVTPTRPMERYRVPVEVAPGQGRLSVVLVHDGFGRTTPDELSGFPYPLTIAVDPALGNAAALMRAYRDLGFEVMALVDVPPQTSRFDAELAVQSILNDMPEIVGVMEGAGDGIQEDRQVAEQVALLLQATGHGLVLRSRGLNTIEQFATREGVPTTTVFRDIDGAGQNERAIQRFLSQAAFRARQADGVVVQARVRPDTITALWVWALEGRDDQTALVPVSEVLRPTRTGS